MHAVRVGAHTILASVVSGVRRGEAAMQKYGDLFMYKVLDGGVSLFFLGHC